MNDLAAGLHAFDRATELFPLGEGRFRGRTSAAYWNMAGPFGGVTAALMLRAVLAHPARRGRPVALTVNFCGAVAEGEFEIAVRLVRDGRSTQHWQVEMRQGEAGAVTTATAVTGPTRPTWGHAAAAAPAAPPAASLAAMDTASRPGWVRAYDMRFVEGEPRWAGRHETPQPARSVLWVRDAPERPLDYPALAALSDVFFIKILQVRGDLPPVATVTLSTYFLADDAEIAEQGSRHVLGVCDARRFGHGFNDQAGELWSDAGVLLAVTSQVVWFKA
jgi:acyl-CoA thioesterase